MNKKEEIYLLSNKVGLERFFENVENGIFDNHDFGQFRRLYFELLNDYFQILDLLKGNKYAR